MFLMSECIPTELIEIDARFQQKVRACMEAWLVRLWDMGGMALAAEEAEKMCIITHICHPEALHGILGFKVLTPVETG